MCDVLVAETATRRLRTCNLYYSTSAAKMQMAQRLYTAVAEFYRDINPATLSGAIDIIVVEREDGTFMCSPFHVRFGKLQLLRASEKLVEMRVNGQKVDFPMKIGDAGEAFFVVETHASVPAQYLTSPVAKPESASELEVEPLELGPPDAGKPNTPVMAKPAMDVPSARPSGRLSRPSTAAEVPGHTGRLDPTCATGDAHNELPQTEAPSPDGYEEGTPIRSSGAPTPASRDSNQDMGPATGGQKLLPPGITTRFPKAGNGLPNESLSQHDYPVSDTELESGRGALGNDQNHPVSDSEAELSAIQESRSAKSARAEESWTWGWGQLPENKSEDDLVATFRTPATVGRQLGKTVTSRLSTRRTHTSSLLSRDLRRSHDVVLSLCGMTGNEVSESLFNEHVVTYEQFLASPSKVLESSNLVVRMGGRYLRYQAAASALICLQVFGKHLPDSLLEKLNGMKPSTPVELRTPAKRPPRYSLREGLRHWWKGSSNGTSSHPQPQVLDMTSSSSHFSRSVPQSPARRESHVSHSARGTKQPSTGGEDGSSRDSPRTLGLPKYATQGTFPDDPSGHPHTLHHAATMPEAIKPKRKYIKSLRLTSDQLKSLQLCYGKNSVSFSVVTKLQGRATCLANIFLWRHDSKLVISDIDGTITKSDALGHLFTMVGRDWTHAGVASLYTNISANGYELLYLTSRAIGQAQTTRNYLSKVEQGPYQLPDGPVIMSPDRLLAAFSREVIQRRPEEFKISCLKDIRRLFGDKNPFYAGFGNRITDAFSYRAVNVPISRIFTVDPSSEICLELLLTYKSSYVKLNDLVDQIFPPVGSILEAEYSDVNFWKQPILEVEELEEESVAPGPSASLAIPVFTQMVESDEELRQAMKEERRKPPLIDLKERATDELMAVKSVIMEAEEKQTLQDKGLLNAEEVENAFAHGHVLDFDKYPYM